MRGRWRLRHSATRSRRDRASRTTRWAQDPGTGHRCARGIAITSSYVPPHSGTSVGRGHRPWFHRFDLLPSTFVAPALGPRAEVRINNALRERVADHAFAERQEVNVHMLPAVARGPLVLDDRGAHTGDLVRRDRRPDAGSAEEDAAFHIAVRDRVGERPDDERVVVIGRGLGTEGDDGVARRFQVLDDRGLQTLAGMVRGDPDPHATVARTFPISASLIAPSRRIFT